MTEPMRREDMDEAGELFGVRFIDGGSNGLIELYIEDDGYWHHKVTFDRAWVSDLRRVMAKTIESH